MNTTTHTAPIAARTFTAALISQGSWGGSNLGEHESTMELYDVDGDAGRGYIEWDIPALDDGECIGLSYEMRAGKRHLTDYDGIFSLPREAWMLLESVGIVVDEEFK